MEKLAFLFTGQGSQYVGMGKSLYDNYEIAKQTFAEASDVLGFDLGKLCFEGGLSQLTKTENTQPALLTVSVASFRVYMQEIGIAPHFLAGHSMGEYAALTCSGALTFADAVKIMQKRGQLTQKVVDRDVGGMTIVDGLPREVIEEEAKQFTNDEQFVMINCFNSPTQFSIAGHRDAVENLEARLLDLDGQVTPLLMSAPFHTPLMNEVAVELKEFLQTLNFNSFRYPVIANISGRPYGDIKDIPDFLAEQTVAPVKWIETMNYLKRYGVTHAIEMGPKNVLCNLVTANTPTIEALCYAERQDRKRLEEMFPEDHHLKRHIPTVVTKCLAAAVATPNHNSDRDAYKKGVSEPYRQIHLLQDELDKTGEQPTVEQMRMALDMLVSVFETKQVSTRERFEWFHHILTETNMIYQFKEYLQEPILVK